MHLKSCHNQKKNFGLSCDYFYAKDIKKNSHSFYFSAIETYGHHENNYIQISDKNHYQQP